MSENEKEIISLKQFEVGTIIVFSKDCLVDLENGTKMRVRNGEEWQITEKMFRRIR